MNLNDFREKTKDLSGDLEIIVSVTPSAGLDMHLDIRPESGSVKKILRGNSITDAVVIYMNDGIEK